jgi:outer membrane protein TolC
LLQKPLDGGNTPNGIDVVTSEQLYLSTQLTLVTARATRFMDAVALFQALGGGWWNRADAEEAGARTMDAVVRSPPPRP